jgi:plasmid stabilization system protein ParE
MAKPIEYLDGARIDFDESFDWYAQRSAGAAIGFASAVDDVLGTILKDPGRFPQTHGGCTYCAHCRLNPKPNDHRTAEDSIDA